MFKSKRVSLKKLIHIALSIILVLCNFTPVSASAVAKYQPTWESVNQHNPAPEWFQDAKFGIYFHWGIFSTPAFSNEWYGKGMYSDPDYVQKHHIEKYGPVNEWGYDKFITGAYDKDGNWTQFRPQLKSAGGKFDPNEWAQLFADAGAKFAGPVAEHHDGYSMWNSDVNEWNSVNLGPKLDLAQLFKDAIRSRDMKFMMAMHHAYNISGFFQDAPKTEDKSLQKLYAQLPWEEENQLWYDKLAEIVDKYQPDMIWQDFDLQKIDEVQRLKFLAYYFNKANEWGKDVVVTHKSNDPGFSIRSSVGDYERGGPADIVNPYWLTDDSVSSSSWCYTEGIGYYSTKAMIHSLIDRVSKNGNLLLNIAPMADGSIPQAQKDILIGMGAWLKKNGEAIYSTRAWTKYGEGPSLMGGGHFVTPFEGKPSDIRFTRNKENNALYAVGMGWPSNNQMLLTSLNKNAFDTSDITEVTLLNGATPVPVTWTQDFDGLKIDLPESAKDTNACAVKIAFSDTIPTLNTEITSGATYKIVARHSGKSIGVVENSTEDGAALEQRTDNGSDSQRWIITDIGEGKYKIINAASRQSVDVSSGSHDNGAALVQWPYNATYNNQKWKIEKVDGGYYKIECVNSGKVFDVSGISTNDGDRVGQWEYVKQANQQFLLINVSNNQVNVSAVTGGTATVKTDKALANKNEIVTIDVSNVESGKQIKSLKVTGADNAQVTVTEVTQNVPVGVKRYTFTMPEQKVTVAVELEPIPQTASAVPSITAQPTAQTVTEGNSAVFSVAASAADNGTLTYQWQMLTKEQGAAWTNINGATNTTYQIAKTTLADNGKQFQCIVTNTKDSLTPATVISNVAELTIKQATATDKKIKSVTNPKEITVAFGTEADKLNLPNTVTVALEDDSAAEVQVIWNTESYKGSKAGEYTLNGALVPQSGIINSDNITAIIKVIVEKQPEPSKDDLLALITTAKEKAKDSKYTQASRDALTKVIDDAQVVANNKDATQPQIAEAQNALQNAIDALVNEQQPENPNKDTLFALIAVAKGMAKDSKYTQESRDALVKAIDDAQVVANSNDATQPQIEAAQKALQAAIDALVNEQEPEKPNKNGLLALIRTAKEKAKDSKYTQASRDALTKAIETAQAVANNDNATKQDIADAQKMLHAAINSLVKQGGSNKPSGESSAATKPRKHVEPNMVSSSGVSEKLASSSKDTDISVRSDYKVATGFLNELVKNKDKSVTLNGDWYSWTLDGKNIENTMPGVIWFDTRITTDSPNADAIGKLTEKADTTNLHFNYEGKLPGKTIIRAQLEKYAGKAVYVYYHNPEKGRLELIQADIKANEQGWFEFIVTDGADYVISPTAIKSAVTKAKNAAEPQK